MKCPCCNGDGQVERTINTGDGMSPDRDVYIICHICEGEGEVADDYYDGFDEDFDDWDEDGFTEDEIDELYNKK